MSVLNLIETYINEKYNGNRNKFALYTNISSSIIGSWFYKRKPTYSYITTYHNEVAKELGITKEELYQKCSQEEKDILNKVAGQKRGNGAMQICMDCAVDNCCWYLKGKPVDGWIANETVIKHSSHSKVNSYKILYCPNFQQAKSRSVKKR